MTNKTLVPVLADQLSLSLAALRAVSPEDAIILMMEVREEATYVPHHRKKIAFLFSAMRHFAKALKDQGFRVDYVRYDEPNNAGSFTEEIRRALKRHPIDRIIVTEPGEYRVRQMMEAWADDFDVSVDILLDDRFLCTHDAFAEWVDGRKQLRMEYFYREMRRSTGLLMDGDDPVGGQWNFDADNRKPARGDLFMPKPPRFEPDQVTKDVLALVAEHFPDGFGDLEPFRFAVTSEQAQAALDHFIEEALSSFGDYQDAMLLGEPFLYHSLLGLYINAGLLDPIEVCKRAEIAYFDGHAPINAVEGFIRQIIGWREYVRGIYWLKMPDYREMNFLEAKRPLPDFYWTGDTDMACLRAAITQTKEEAYAHHIQRLMVTGNFALLAGIDPHEMHEWYLSVYADAYEWVELPNTLGMSQFGDGGLLGSKPYAASGNYINKMSDYCPSCAYKVKEKTGPTACPFNPLYWDFFERNRDKLQGNPRLGQMYRTWDRMDESRKADVLQSAKVVLQKLEAPVRERA